MKQMTSSSKGMRRRLGRLLLPLAGLVLVSGLMVHGTRPKAQPNILFIAIDDLYTSIGTTKDAEGNFLRTIYPDSLVRAQVAARLTPNINQLAAQSRMFVKATCQSPLCGPSRTALMTGVPTHISEYYSHHEHFRANEQLKDAVTLPQYLKANGYFTAGIGKVFHTSKVESLTPEGDWPDTKYSWTQWVSSNGGAGLGGAKQPAMSPNKGLMSFGPGDEPKEKTNDWQNSLFTSTLLQTGKASSTDVFTKEVVTVTLPADKPFFLASGIFRPHLPFFAPKAYFELFPTSEMAIDTILFEKVKNDLVDLPPAGLKWTQLTKGKFAEVIEQGEKVGGKEGQLEAWKQCLQAYLACVAFADECVGEILHGLDNSKYKDNTIVFLWSDHGFFMGNKARLAKQAIWWEALNTNFIVRMPKQKQPGVANAEYVQLTDLYPTVVSLCSLEKPERVMGEDITPLIMDPSAKLKRKYTYSTYLQGNHSIFSGDYKFIRYENGDKELYNIKTDVFEFINLANDSQYKNILDDFDKALDEELTNAKKYSLGK